MFRIARPDSSKNGAGLPSFGPNSGESVGMAQEGLSRGVQSIERFVAQRPGFCLGAALSVGIALGWWVKRS
jgi:hypothetical protein